MDFEIFIFILFSYAFFRESENYVVDHFERTPPMSTFTFGFVISQLVQLNRTSFPDVRLKNLCVKVYARPDLFRDLDASVSRIILKCP